MIISINTNSMIKDQNTYSDENSENRKQVGQVAYVDFYFEGFDRDASQVTLIVGKEYTIHSVIGNFCENKEFLWYIWGATPTSPKTQSAKVKFNSVGIFTVELILRTSHVGGGSVCSSNGEQKKINYVRVVK